MSRANSTNSPARRKPKKPSQDTTNGDSLANPDPAVFEAAFVLDDDDVEPAVTRSSSPEKVSKEGSDGNENNDGAPKQNTDAEDRTGAVAGDESKDVASTAPAELPPQVKAKLRKLEKLEATYPG